MKSTLYIVPCLIGLLAGYARTEPIALDQALAQAMAESPVLESATHALRAAEARSEQSGRFPNPELGIDVEEYDRGGQGFDSAETAVTLGQALELGGKRGARKRLARLEHERAQWDYSAARLDVYATTRVRFIEALTAQRRAALAEASIALAEKSAQVVEERVRAGREPPLQAGKAQAELELARMDRDEARRHAAASRNILAAMWGDREPGFSRMTGELEIPLPALPALESLLTQLARNPDLARWETELQAREAAQASARAARMPDLEASVGYQRFQEDGTESLAFGIGIPLPLFDRNQGEIMAAAYEHAGAESGRRAAELALNAELTEVHARVASAQAQAAVLMDRVVPALEDALAAAQEGYRQGKLGYLDVLDAQRSLSDTRKALLETLSTFHLGLARIDRLTGTPSFATETEP